MARLQQIQDYRVDVPDLAAGIETFQKVRASQIAAERGAQQIEQGEQIIQSNILAAEQAELASAEAMTDADRRRVAYVSKGMMDAGSSEEAQNKFLQSEIQRLNDAGIDYSDTLELLSMDQTERNEAVTAGYASGVASGHIVEGDSIAVMDAVTGKPELVTQAVIARSPGRYSLAPKTTKTTTKKIKVDGEVHEVMFDNAGKIIADLGEVPEKEGKSTFDKSAVIRSEIAKHEKDFTAVGNAFSRVKIAAANPSPAGDLALVFNYMKMLDPGSVVRESEFKTAAEAKAWLGRADEEGFKIPNKIRSLILKAEEGQILLPEQRADFLKTAENLFVGADKKNKKFRRKKIKQAKLFGVTEAMIFLEEDEPKVKGGSVTSAEEYFK